MGLNVCDSNSYVDILPLEVTVLEGGTFERLIGCKSEAPMNGLSALIEVAPES